MAERDDVLIIGGGAVGICCALELARSGRHVRLLERGPKLCSGCSAGNAGLVPTSVCGPIAEPGAVRQSLRWMFDPSGPFRLRPRADMNFARWLWLFRRFCEDGAWRRGVTYSRDLIRASLKIFQERAAEIDFDFRQNGVRVLFQSEESLHKGNVIASVMRDLDIRSNLLSRQDIIRLEPRVTSEVIGGIHYPEDAHLHPVRFVEAMGTLAEREGVRIQVDTEVTAMETAGNKVSIVKTKSGDFVPSLVVLAAGAWSPRISAQLRLPLLIEPGKGYSLTVRGDACGFETPLRLSEAKTVVTPMGKNLRLTSKLDLVGLNLDLNQRRLRDIRESTEKYLQLKIDFEKAEQWCGLRPLTPDGLPIVGPHPHVSNLLLATGHGHLGLALSTITGRMIAQIAAGETPSFDLEPMRPDRFERRVN